MAWLEIIASDGTTSRFSMDKDTIEIGRATTNDLSIVEPSISGKHCVLSKNGPVWVLRDLDSTNGTRVNATKIKEAELKTGDVIGVGAKRIIFKDPIDSPTMVLPPSSLGDTVRLPAYVGDASGFEQRGNSARWVWRVVLGAVILGAVVAMVWFVRNLMS
jgi:pSer/pThr/pTyr-binding forkhead associated (FHA) protein